MCWTNQSDSSEKYRLTCLRILFSGGYRLIIGQHKPKEVKKVKMTARVHETYALTRWGLRGIRKSRAKDRRLFELLPAGNFLGNRIRAGFHLHRLKIFLGLEHFPHLCIDPAQLQIIPI